MLKNILIIPFLLLIWATFTMADDNFYLKIDLLNSESSKDSNSQRYIVEVNGKEVWYEYTYSGFPFPDDANEKKTRTLSDNELSKIISYIKEEGINKSITENKSTGANNPSRKVHLLLFLKMEGHTTESEISGNTKIFRGDGKVEGLLIGNNEYVDAVESLIQDLKN